MGPSNKKKTTLNPFVTLFIYFILFFFYFLLFIWAIPCNVTHAQIVILPKWMSLYGLMSFPPMATSSRIVRTGDRINLTKTNSIWQFFWVDFS